MTTSQTTINERKKIWKTLKAIYDRKAEQHFYFTLNSELFGTPQFVPEPGESVRELSITQDKYAGSRGEVITMKLWEHTNGPAQIVVSIEHVPPLFYNEGLLTEEAVPLVIAMRQANE